MWKKLILIISILIIYLLLCNIIYNKYTTNEKNSNKNKVSVTINKIKNEIINIQSKETPIGKLIINKINLKQDLYDTTSAENNIEKHVTILNHSEEPSINNSIMFIAAHSGSGPIAFFNDLDKLTINDQIILEYKEKRYTYIIKDIWEIKKKGTITVPKENTTQLILTTCSPNRENYQLIINSHIKN